MRNFDLNLSKPRRIPAWRTVHCVNHTQRNWSQNFSHRVSLKLRSLRRSWWFWVLRDAKPIVVQFSKLPQHFCLRFLFVLQALCAAFYLVVLQPCRAGTSTWCTINTLIPETALVSLRTLALSLSTGNKNLFLFQRHLSPSDVWPLHLFKFSRAWRQSFVNGVSDLYFFHHSIQFLIVANRHLLMEIHVVQFQYVFELIRLTYPQFAQTFQGFIGWNFCHR